MAVEYRPIKPEDYAAVRQFLSDSGWQSRVQDPVRFRTIMERADRTVVVLENSRVIGFGRALCDDVSNGYISMVAVLDWFSRYVVSWELDQTLELPFVLTAVERALRQAQPQIWNSDQGSHFTSPQYTALLQAAQVQISMDGRGRAMDNIFTERLWRTVKYEEVYLHDYATPREARQGLTRYFGFYNHERPHQALDYRTPAQVCFHREEAQLLYLDKGSTPIVDTIVEGIRAR